MFGVAAEAERERQRDVMPAAADRITMDGEGDVVDALVRP